MGPHTVATMKVFSNEDIKSKQSNPKTRFRKLMLIYALFGDAGNTKIQPLMDPGTKG